MNNTVILLERVRSICEPQSKNQTAIKLGMDQSTLRGMYRGNRYPNHMHCIEISKILRIELAAVLSYVAEDKARSAHSKAEARKHAPRLHPAAGLALAFAVGLMMFGYNDAQASALNRISDGSIFNHQFDLSIHYAKLVSFIFCLAWLLHFLQPPSYGWSFAQLNSKSRLARIWALPHSTMTSF